MSDRLLFVSVAALGVLLVMVFRLDYVSGDPLAYYERIAPVVEGEIPYIEAPFEHLPGMIVPMVLTWVAGGWSSPFAYRGVWTMLSIVGGLILLHGIRRLGETVGYPTVTRRWIYQSLPVIPLILFRNDVWPTMLAVFAVDRALTRRRSFLWFDLTGGLAKGWPVIVGVVGWFRGRRWGAALVTAVTLTALAAVAVSPGFRIGRTVSGLHTETFGASLYRLTSSGGGGAARYFDDGAIYIVGPRIWGIPGLVVGSALIVAALVRMRRHRADGVGILTLLGAVVFGLLLASPVQSAQFVFWATPFTAFSHRKAVAWMQFGICTCAMFTVAAFPLLFRDSTLWHGVNLARNLLILGCGSLLVASVRPSEVG